ncbi:hypothetical protein [Kitasatospora phosalacinea]|uniref:hypothetical protein n=1 Tax=Kitasatospora phosalacinea TaxID=2065 RepID=UPI0012FF3AF3|nr:hypothetical protein [Kitasatospora phosalacinea]
MFNRIRMAPSWRRRVVARLAAALTALAAVMATAGVAAAPAQATEGPSPVWYTGIVRSWAQGRCLDSNDNGEVYTIPCNGSRYQQWNIIIQNHPKDEWATVWIQNVQTGRFLEPHCDTCGSWQPGVWTSGSLDALRAWLLFPTNDNWTAWRFAWNPGITQRCLDANTPTDTTSMHPYLSYTDWQPAPLLPPNFCSSNYQDWKLGF